MPKRSINCCRIACPQVFEIRGILNKIPERVASAADHELHLRDSEPLAAGLIADTWAVNLLDPRTTVLIGSITCGLMALVLTLLARATPLPVPGLRSWVLGAWTIFVALVLLGLRDWIPDLASITLGNMALMLAYLIWLAGTHEHFGARLKWTPWISGLALVILAITWLNLTQDSFRLRVVIVATFCACISARHAWVLLRRPRAARFGETNGITLAICWFVALGCTYGLRCVHAIAYPQGSTGLLTQDIIQVVYTAALTACNLMSVIGFATMASDNVRAQIENQAVRDPLTGTLNRRALFESLDREISRYHRSGRSFSVAMLDIDHFKSVNDQYGHQIGDRVLVHMCQRVTALMRPHDIFARYGGEEFLILMPETNVLAAQQAARRVNQELGKGDDPSLPAVTVSMGIAECSPGDTSALSLVARADRALYAAKNKGRNRVEIDELAAA